jgi:peptidoglycan hydrolase-like protein with peptidoglycan-binding domain
VITPVPFVPTTPAIIPIADLNTYTCSTYISPKAPIEVGDLSNDPLIVTKIQLYLNVFENANLVTDGVYNQDDAYAVLKFQEKYAAEILAPWGFTTGTGIVFTTTAKKMNAVMCSMITPVVPVVPVLPVIPVVTPVIPVTPIVPNPLAPINITVTPAGLCEPYVSPVKPITNTALDNDPIEVSKIQTYLNTFEDAGLVVDGVYDEADVNAVRAFQQRHALEILAPWGFDSPTGVVYTTTAAKMNAVVCGKATMCPYFSEYVGPGDNSAEVAKVKGFVNLLLRTNLDTNSTYYDDATTNVVKQFQAKYSDFILAPWGFDTPTGLWYQTTSRQANKFMGCELPPLTLPNGVVVQ